MIKLQNNNSEMATQFLELLRLQGLEGQVRDLSSMIVPVVNFGQNVSNIVKRVSGTTTGTSTIYTVPADKVFFLVAANISGQQDVLCDSTGVALQTSAGGLATTVLIDLMLSPATVTSDSIAQSYPLPIRYPPSTVFAMSGSFTAGAQIKRGTIIGFEVGFK